MIEPENAEVGASVALSALLAAALRRQIGYDAPRCPARAVRRCVKGSLRWSGLSFNRISRRRTASMSSPTTSRSSRAGASRTATTPQRASATSGSAAIAGPGVGGTALAPSVSASPHYTTSLRSRHSLYGTEDRVVLDFGSSVVKAGFSGETGPRECRRTNGSRAGAAGARTRALPVLTTEEEGLWGYEKGEPSEEEWQAREHRLKRVVRSIWFECVCSSYALLVSEDLRDRTNASPRRNLLTDPRSRKVIVLENPLLSTRVKEMIARILFDNLQVRP